MNLETWFGTHQCRNKLYDSTLIHRELYNRGGWEICPKEGRRGFLSCIRDELEMMCGLMLPVSESYSRGNNTWIYQEQAKNNKGQRKKRKKERKKKKKKNPDFVLNELWAAWAITDLSVSGPWPKFQFFSATLFYIPVTIMINNSTGSQQR